jgi:hypothetical protein
MKCHLVRTTSPQAVEHMHVLREAVGTTVDIMVDVKQQWSVKQTIAYTTGAGSISAILAGGCHLECRFRWPASDQRGARSAH